MKVLISIFWIFLAAIFSCSNNNHYYIKKTEETEKEWLQFIDTVGTLFIIKFEYPKNYVAEQIQNGICVGKSIKKPHNDITNSSDWCIWIEDGETYSIEGIMNQEKSTLGTGEKLSLDTVLLSEKKAIHLYYETNLMKKGIFQKEIIIQDRSPVILVIKKESDIEGFERFLNSIQIINYTNK